MLEKTLEKIGLSEKEAKVYVALLELGQATVQQIAQKARVVRPTTYVILEKLMTSGLVSTLAVGKKTMFVAEDPHELTNILEEQTHTIETRRRELTEVMNQFTAIYNAQKGKPIVRYFEGADGLQALDRYGHTELKPGSTIYTFMPIDLIEERFPARRSQSVAERVKLKVRSRVIYTHKNGPIASTTNAAELREAVYVPREQFPIDATLTVYPGWCLKIYYFGQELPYGVLIESPEIARNFQLFFELAWAGAHAQK